MAPGAQAGEEIPGKRVYADVLVLVDEPLPAATTGKIPAARMFVKIGVYELLVHWLVLRDVFPRLMLAATMLYVAWFVTVQFSGPECPR